MKTRASVADVVSCILCKRWNKKKVREKFGRKKYITIKDVLACRSIRWYDKVWVIGQVFFNDNPFYCFHWLEYEIDGLNPDDSLFKPITAQKKRTLLRKIRAQAIKEGLM